MSGVDTEFDISIIICCYNSAARLPETIKHIAAQQSGSVKWEVIVVDNASTDNSAAVAGREFEKHNIHTGRMVFEATPGLSSARRKGVLESKGKYVLFCDDDNWLDENYLHTAWEIMESDPKIGMLGGVGEAFIEGETPKWFNRFRLTYAVGPQHTEAADISYIKGYVYGAGAVVRKVLLLQLDNIGFEHVLTDRIGNKMVSGGDNEIGYALVLMGYKIYSTPQLKFKHYIPQGRLTKEYISKIQLGQVLTTPVVKLYENFLHTKTISYKKPGTRDVIIVSKKIVKLNLQWINKEVDDFDYYLRIRKLAGLLKYHLFSEKLHESNYLKVKRNIEIIGNFVSQQNKTK